MKDDVAGLVERLTLFSEYVQYDPPINYEDRAAATMNEAASIIRAQDAEIERLREDWDSFQRVGIAAEAKLREAVELVERLESVKILMMQPVPPNNLELEAASTIRAQAARITELEDALRTIIGWLDDPTGGSALGDMRQASAIAFKALGDKP
jgi:hypothetical protein